MTDGDPGRTSTPAWYAPKRWLYRGGRPGRIATAMNAFWARLYSRGWLAFGRGATLEVRGRTSGRTVTLPVAIADHDGGRYLVSMLGDRAGWVLNVRAAGGAAVLVERGTRTPVRLVEVPVGGRAEILRRYLAIAPGARPHIPVARTAPPAELERVAADFPAFRIEAAAG